MPSLEARLRSAAMVNSTLATLLGTTPFRWYDSTLQQGTAFPAVVVQQIFGGDIYTWAGRNPTGFSRYQFAIWDTDPERGRLVDDAMSDFFTTFNGPQISGVPLCWYGAQVVLRLSKVFSLPEPVLHQRILQVSIFSN
jgi:hypothetical protein